MVTYDYSNVVVGAPSSFQSAEAIRAEAPAARLLSMVFGSCGCSVGHRNSIDIERVGELLETREYAGSCK